MKKHIDSTRKLTAGIDGWLSDKEGEFLFNKAKACTGRGVIVEIGSWKGRSTVWLGLGSKEGVKTKVYAIDPHNAGSDQDFYGKVNTLKEFKENIKKAGLNKVVISVLKDSSNAVKDWNKPIELLFIDGSHKYDIVKKDFLDWSKYLIEGGTIAFHDTILFSGPRNAVNEIILSSKNFREFMLVDSITSATKVKSIFLNDKMKKLVFRIKKARVELKLNSILIKNHITKKLFSRVNSNNSSNPKKAKN